MKMKMKTLLPILLTIPLALSSCSSEPEPSADKSSDEAVGTYPLSTCVVSDEDLGSMGEPVIYDHEGTTVKFCCKQCLPKFKKDPEKYLAKLKK
jgi:hypothetical protein